MVLDGDPEKLSALDPRQHVYLHDLSGDFYSFDSEKKEWAPQGNFGLHNSRQEASIHGEAVRGASAVMKKVKPYQDLGVDTQKPYLMFTNAKDVRCLIKRECLSHWLFKGQEQKEFVMVNNNLWDPHPINITKKNLD